MKIGSICSGIGGLDLAVEKVFKAEVSWFVEKDRFASKILDNHWPGIPNYGDVRDLLWHQVPKVDIFTMGMPCQPYSHAGLKLENDERIIWHHIYRGVRILQPRYVIMENVAAHVTNGFPQVIGDLAESGYDAKWACLPASDIGAAHKRDRLYCIATNTKSV